VSAWVVQSGRWLHRKRQFPDESLARTYYDGLVEKLVREETKVCAVLVDPNGAAVATYRPATGVTAPEDRAHRFEPGTPVEFAKAIGLPWQPGRYVRLARRGQHEVRDAAGACWTVFGRRLRRARQD
jgi:hypothetical protein